jgi:hypothetical protein
MAVAVFFVFLLRIAEIPSSTSGDYFLGKMYAMPVPKEIVLRLITVGCVISSDFARRNDSGAYSGIKLASWH